MAAESSTDLSSEDSILYPCRKTREEPDPDDHDSIHLSEPEINKLPDAMLFEILSRLPCRLALQCKSISKRWYSLISDPSFIRGFCHRHRKYSDPFTFLLQCGIDVVFVPSENSDLYLHCCGGEFDFLNFLPFMERPRKICPCRIEAAFNDLLLVSREVPPICFTEYYICNPLTKQWLMLPSRRTRIVMVGFICEPYSDKELAIANYRYKVVRWICCPFESKFYTSELQMEIFSSETGEWSNFVVSLPRGRRFNPIWSNIKRIIDIKRIIEAGVVACNGMLHWLDVDREDKMIEGFVAFDPWDVDEEDKMIEAVVVFDPFNENAEQCLRYIDPPIEFLRDKHFSFGVFQGRLRIFQSDFQVVALFLCLGTRGLRVHFLAFHPKDGEIVYLRFWNSVVLWNMRTMVWKIEGQLGRRGVVLPRRSSRYLAHVPANSVFLLGKPSWPTPVPPLPIVSY
uniref:F-box domain-containing protein n=1 Tax=Fagus sylvatica TaxID=28930 RepID=A0A2N9EDJ8_FAGSY